LHIACFIILCEAFLGVNPDWGPWKYLFRLHPNAFKEEVHDLGGTIISVRSESQYLAFEMAESFHRWRPKWFYIKDQKFSKVDKNGLAPFDLAKSLTKLTTWHALPSKTKVEEIKPLLARIQELKNVVKKELNGIQLIVFFLQRRIQPLQARVSKLWTYSGLTDPSRVSQKDPELKDLEKRVRSLTTLTAKKTVPACLVVPFDATHPLLKVLDL
jgi:hypothetical protein